MSFRLFLLAFLTSVGAVSAAEFSDDFTDNTYTQANWTFFSPYACIPSGSFTASAVAANGSLCVNSTGAAEPFFHDNFGIDGAETLVFGYVHQPFDSYNVSIFAGVSFTTTEINETDNLTKGVFLRGDIRSAPFVVYFGCPPSSDGGDAYVVNMEPHSSSGENRFSIWKYVSGNHVQVKAGPSYVWPAEVRHNVYFSVSWDPVQQTNHLRAVLYLDSIQSILVDLTADDDSLKPQNLDPGNNGNQYAGILMTNDSGGSIANECMTTASHAYCPSAFGKLVVRDSLARFSSADADGDGVPDACDDCPNTIAGSPVDATGCPPLIPGDFDRDGDVDGDDLAVLADCRSGAGLPIANAALCAKADLDHDGDSDHDDFGILQRCYSGANAPADPGCAGIH